MDILYQVHRLRPSARSGKYIYARRCTDDAFESCQTQHQGPSTLLSARDVIIHFHALGLGRVLGEFYSSLHTNFARVPIGIGGIQRFTRKVEYGVLKSMPQQPST